MRRRGWIGFVTALAVLLAACSSPGPDRLRLNDFESEAALDALRWKCRTSYARSPLHATHGRSSLLLTMYPDEYPGVAFHLWGRRRDWSGYDRLALSVFNPQEQPLRWHYRIDDRQQPPYADRVNGTLELRPGMNHIALDLRALRTSGSRRPLDLGRIQALCFFLVSPPAPVRLYVDDVRLERKLLK